MRQNDFAHYFFDQPDGWNFSEERVDIRGWIHAKDHTELVDLRVKLDGEITYGIMGLDRPDLCAFFEGSPSAVKSGFRIVVCPWRGARTLVFEVLRADNQWVEFERAEITTSGSKMPSTRPKRRLRTAFISESLFYLYRHFHFEPDAVLKDEAKRVLNEITVHQTEILPENDMIGYLDLPTNWVNAHYEKFRVSGWAFSVSKKISRLTATIRSTSENRLIWGKEREDVLSYHPQYPQSLNSAFYGLVDVRNDAFSPACLKIFVEAHDGPRQLLRSKRIFINKLDENSGPIPVYSETKYFRVVRTFLETLWREGYAVENWRDMGREVLRTRRALAEKMIRGFKSGSPAVSRNSHKEPYDRWVYHNRLTPLLLSFLRRQAASEIPNGPKISLVVPTYNTPKAYLEELITAVTDQVYSNWELCFADDASTEKHVALHLAAAAARDPRIKYVIRPTNGHISAATNSALDLATGDFVAFVDHDDLLPPDALLHVAEAIRDRPTADLLYTDEDKIDTFGRRYDPQLKGGWSPEMAITHNYVHHLTVIRRDLIERAGRLREGFEGAQDIDLILRCVELIANENIVHVPFVCYHWRAHDESTASRGDQKGYLFDAARRSISEAVRRRGLRAEPFLPPLMQDYALSLHQLKWDASLLEENHVTIVIPTKNHADLLSACVASLDRTVNWKYVQLIVVDDGSTEASALQLLSQLEARTDVRCRVIRTGNINATFNYSHLVNLGSFAATTPLILHLNNDVTANQPGWLEDLVGWSSVSGVGVVGARLLYPDERINHAGIWVAPNAGLAHGMFVGLPKDDFGYLFLPHAARNVTAVTGACLLTRADLYRKLGGFDENDFKVAYNDVDYCIRAARAGFRTVYSPQATLTHLGSASRGKAYTVKEHLAFVRRYPDFADPFISEVAQPVGDSFRLNPYIHRFSHRRMKLRMAIVTHNLRLEGAPLFILEYARYFADVEGWDVRIFSPTDGPLREKFEDSGLKVDVLDLDPVLKASNATAFHRAIDLLAKDGNWRDLDLIIGNTMLAYWVVPLAKKLGLPSALYIHESNAPRRFFSEHNLAAPEVIPIIEDALREATRVVFIAEATRKIFADLNVHDNFRLINSWIDVERIERFMAAHSREALRAKHGIAQDAVVVVNVGSVCQRKGQHIFIRAIDRLSKDHGPELARQGPLEFIMVGAREGLYLDTIKEDIDLLGISNARLVPETFDVYDWYRLADVFCCTSFEESFPRVLLEAAAFRLPIVSTNVNGIPEMFVNNDHAFLIGAGDHHKLAATLKKALDARFSGETSMTAMAFARVSRCYDSRISLPAHVAMAREIYFG